MNYSFFYRTDAAIICLILFVGCILVVKLGTFLRNRFLRNNLEDSKGGVNALLGALFGLWGFLLAFTFSNASSRFDNIVSISVDEYNAIRDVVFRAETFPDSIRNGFRDDLNSYIKSIIDYNNFISDNEKVNKAKEDIRRASKMMWARTQRASKLPNMDLPAENMFAGLLNMFDLVTKLDAMVMATVPDMIFYLLFFMAFVISFIGGFTTPVIGTKEWIIIVGFILLASIIIFITIDLSRPMRGSIRTNIGQERINQLQYLYLKK